ncbi:YggS family pyridoxal phosphate-dependent enzyme [Cryobacterium frigoriphilum]|uniref:YggS family pyridoxal phosphate-dependent enzyme n=1 Tax=Cryobacterium frigoriphilum TaxID=1259150 RepID=UPI001F542A21|nr:YggS family pyridoxal phosphate-dependent enzyme [Cryobacterium frigoriphilum]
MIDTLDERLQQVRAGIADAVRLAGRDPSEITTVVVTKFHPASLIAQLAALGVTDVGESRHQEAQGKAAELADLNLTWHFIGQIQGKKARQVRAYANVIHSLDRASLVTALAAPDAPGTDAPVRDCFIQVNLTDDPARGGAQPSDLEALAEQVLATSGLRLLGLMAVAPREGEPRRAFAAVRALSVSLRSIAPQATALSIGMSQDYQAAISEGATHLRIGTAITGIRPLHG